VQFTPIKKSANFCSDAHRKQFALDKKQVEIKNSGLYVTCELCGFVAAKGLVKHIMSHGITVAAYRKQFPAALIVIEATSKKISAAVSGEKNAFFNHGGKLSRFSKNHKKYNGLSDDEKTAEISAFAKDREFDPLKMQNRIEHYLAKGLSEAEAKVALSERQTTFSLEKCVERHGPELGLAKWQARQERWHKSYKKSNYSKISQTLFHTLHIEFADAIFAECVKNNKNNEAVIKTVNGPSYKPDFLYQQKIIEFDGDYWHERRQLNGVNAGREALRDKHLIETGFSVLHIKESEYYKDPEGTIEKCRTFLRT
jgi:hypothetical protein